MNIENFLKISDNIYTSGLPTIQDFKEIKENGFKIIISLTMPSDSKTLENEEAILTKLGLTYIHIPVIFSNPTIENFEIFKKILNSFKDKKLWIHCTRNYRVSTFIYLYKLIELNKNYKELLTKFWEPNEIWQKFIEDVKNS